MENNNSPGYTVKSLMDRIKERHEEEKLESRNSSISRDTEILVLSGGAEKGFIELGALHYLTVNNYLDTIKTYIGTSIGSLISYLLVLGYTPLEIFTHGCIRNLENELNPNLGLLRLPKFFGLCSFDKLTDELELLTKAKLEFIPSLSELYEEYDKELVCVTYDLSNKKVVYLTRHNYPHLSCTDAIKMSCNIPFMFDKLVYDNNFYIDGAFGDNFPVIYADNVYNLSLKNDEGYKNKKIIGINVQSDFSISKNEDFMNYIYSILSISIDENRRISCNYHSENVKIINIRTEDINQWNLKLSPNQKHEYFSLGFKYLENLCKI
jgi:hypothetical protein